MNNTVTEQQLVKIKAIEYVTHDVRRITAEKPTQFNFNPGQAVEVSIDKPSWEDEKRPFSFTCLPSRDYLEFTIKTYPLRKGVTNEILQLKKNDRLILHDVFGAIAYKGEGVFIAGGAGVTPFICIFRYLQSKNELGDNMLIFANKRKEDIILAQEFHEMLGGNFINILSDENIPGYLHGTISEGFLRACITGSARKIYLCGPPPMMDSVLKQLANLNINENAIVKEAL